MFCPTCRHPLPQDAIFCSRCGLSTIQVNATTSPNQPQTDDPHDPLIGVVLDSKYKLLERLGEGGMGTVYRAQRLHIGDDVAVKLLHRELALDKQALERFRREARLAAKISHQNVVSIHDFSDASDNNEKAYIVMELVSGESLGTLLRRAGRLSPQRAVSLMRDICAGVGVAHRMGLLHRDLKPDNVIVTSPRHDGEHESVKVVDFGLAKVRDITATAALTRTGAVIGTLYYMSPEQCSGEELDARADVYSLGAMLYEMLTGGPPFQSNNMVGLIAKHLNEAPPPFPESLQIPQGLVTICARALSKNREHRQADAVAFRQELDGALSANQEPLRSAPTLRATPIGQGIEPLHHQVNPLKWAIISMVSLFAIVLLVGTGFAIKYGVDRFTERRTDATSGSVNANSSANASDQPATTGQQATDPESETTNASRFDLRGAWTGTYGPLGQPAKLTIKTHVGSVLDGVLEQGATRVAFSGTLDSKSRKITMKQTAVISGEGWSLGDDVGTISTNGKQMSGNGRDQLGGQLGMSYHWSFTRQLE
jgi:serine/threonine protein kinase